MSIILETNRLILRTFSIEDAKSMFKLNLDNDVLKYTGDKPFKSIKDAELFLKNYSDYNKNGFGRWSVFLKNDEYIGWCGLKLNEENTIDIGFRFFKKYWNNGYATESAKACLNYGFTKLNLKEIIGRTDNRNIGSKKVLEKINMNFWKKGNFEGVENGYYYKITKEQFDQNKI